MHPYYSTYRWKEGKPIGNEKVDPYKVENAYRIVSDPYHKWLSIEKYERGSFLKNVYDSRILDFRKLKPQDQIAWQKTYIKDTPEHTVSWIRNQDDRIILREECFFEGKYCTHGAIYSLENSLLSMHRLFFRERGDPNNATVFFDRENRPVFFRLYKDWKEGEFHNLEKEEWEVKSLPFEISF